MTSWVLNRDDLLHLSTFWKAWLHNYQAKQKDRRVGQNRSPPVEIYLWGGHHCATTSPLRMSERACSTVDIVTLWQNKMLVENVPLLLFWCELVVTDGFVLRACSSWSSAACWRPHWRVWACCLALMSSVSYFGQSSWYGILIPSSPWRSLSSAGLLVICFSSSYCLWSSAFCWFSWWSSRDSLYETSSSSCSFPTLPWTHLVTRTGCFEAFFCSFSECQWGFTFSGFFPGSFKLTLKGVNQLFDAEELSFIHFNDLIVWLSSSSWRSLLSISTWTSRKLLFYLFGW